MERILDIAGAFDKRNEDPAKNYGVHSTHIRMVIKGELGAVQFLVFSGRHIPTVTEEMVNKFLSLKNCKIIQDVLKWSGPFNEGNEIQQLIDYQKLLDDNEFPHKFLFSPMPADVGYHSPKPLYQDQTCITSTSWKIEENEIEKLVWESS